jgi:hypothetical protein
VKLPALDIKPTATAAKEMLLVAWAWPSALKEKHMQLNDEYVEHYSFSANSR